jgi:hypothetical protein
VRSLSHFRIRHTYSIHLHPANQKVEPFSDLAGANMIGAAIRLLGLLEPTATGEPWRIARRPGPPPHVGSSPSSALNVSFWNLARIRGGSDDPTSSDRRFTPLNTRSLGGVMVKCPEAGFTIEKAVGIRAYPPFMRQKADANAC